MLVFSGSGGGRGSGVWGGGPRGTQKVISCHLVSAAIRVKNVMTLHKPQRTKRLLLGSTVKQA